jgi:hypothetical protein
VALAFRHVVDRALLDAADTFTSHRSNGPHRLIKPPDVKPVRSG